MAQYSLGCFYNEGLGVPQDRHKAFNLFAKAAKQGHKEAQYNVGYMYGNGWGVERNQTLANYWFREAAKNGHPQASAMIR